MTEPAGGVVVAVSRNDAYSFSKPERGEVILVAGRGIDGDVHAGVHVRHRSRLRADPTQPNLRQVHLMHAELFDEVRAQGYDVGPGQMGENVTTRGIDLLRLPRGTVLRFGPPGDTGRGRPPVVAEETAAREAVAEVLAAAGEATLNEATATAVMALEAAAERAAPDGGTAVAVMGLRNPCQQINRFRAGLLNEVIGRDRDGNVVRKGGVMAVVLYGGVVRPGDVVRAELPPGPHEPLECV